MSSLASDRFGPGWTTTARRSAPRTTAAGRR
jgi:hypothetical protein